MAALLDDSFDIAAPTQKPQTIVDDPIENAVRPDPPSHEGGRFINVGVEDCLPWKWADRPAEEFGSLDDLAQSMKKNGQQEPILVRPSQGTASHQYEIIFGQRRWRAAKIAGIGLLAIVKTLSDKDAVVAQTEENNNRENLSDYARALSYQQLIDAGIYKNEAEMGKELGISRQTLNDIMGFLRVPELLATRIPNYRYLSRRMVARLATLSKDKEKLDILLKLATKIGEGAVNASNIVMYLERQKPTKKIPLTTYTKKDSSGKQCYKTKVNSLGGLTININHELIEKLDPKKVHEKFYNFLMELT